MKYLFLFFISISSISAQSLEPIPDEALRKELERQGFIVNESLYIPKTVGRLQLELDGKGIENLDGLQHFKQVWRLTIRNNKIKNLDHLPPNLTVLDCSYNEIEIFTNIPLRLDWLSIDNNKLVQLGPLPSSLTGISFANNNLQYLPTFPSNLKYINYSNNPIDVNSLPDNYKKISCLDLYQNCLAYNLRNWRILNSSLTDSSWIITGMQVIQSSNYSWGQGSQMQTTVFKLKKAHFIASKTQVIRKTRDTETTKYISTKYSFKLSDLTSILKDIFMQKMIIEFSINDTLKTVNLENKRDGQTNFGTCEDCSGHGFLYNIYTTTDTLSLSYGFQMEPSLQKGNELVDIKPILDWLYVHKLSTLTIPKNEIVKYYFNDKTLNGIIDRLE
jgi:hypothetical protein